jgi:hypothetical protein
MSELIIKCKDKSFNGAKNKIKTIIENKRNEIRKFSQKINIYLVIY